MTAAAALLAQQPVAFWLAVTGVLLAAALASGRGVAVAAAAATSLAALVALAAPAAAWAQAAAAVVGPAAVAGSALSRRSRRRAPGGPAEAAAAGRGEVGEARLLGRTARTRAPFVAGHGEVEVDGRPRSARALTPDEFMDGGVLVRIVRVGEAALVVRPLQASAS